MSSFHTSHICFAAVLCYTQVICTGSSESFCRYFQKASLYVLLVLCPSPCSIPCNFVVLELGAKLESPKFIADVDRHVDRFVV
jgi:hypothetical protein